MAPTASRAAERCSTRAARAVSSGALARVHSSTKEANAALAVPFRRRAPRWAAPAIARRTPPGACDLRPRPATARTASTAYTTRFHSTIASSGNASTLTCWRSPTCWKNAPNTSATAVSSTPTHGRHASKRAPCTRPRSRSATLPASSSARFSTKRSADAASPRSLALQRASSAAARAACCRSASVISARSRSALSMARTRSTVRAACSSIAALSRRAARPPASGWSGAAEAVTVVAMPSAQPAAADPSGLLLRGRDRHAARDVAGAASLYGQALAVAPAHPEANHLYGLALVELGQFEVGLGFLRRSIELQPDDATMRFNLGRALLLGGQAA